MSEIIIYKVGGRIVPNIEEFPFLEGEFYHPMFVTGCHNGFDCSNCIELEFCPNARAKSYRKFFKNNKEEINKLLSLWKSLDQIISNLKYKKRFINKLICHISRFRRAIKKWRRKK